MNAYERQRLLIDRILDHLADPAVAVSTTVDECIRLAELRRDHANLWWLRVETIGLADKREMDSLDTEMAASTASTIGSPSVLRPRAGLVRIGSGFLTSLARTGFFAARALASAGSDSVGATSVAAPPSAALRPSAAFRSAVVYWFQLGLAHPAQSVLNGGRG